MKLSEGGVEMMKKMIITICILMGLCFLGGKKSQEEVQRKEEEKISILTTSINYEKFAEALKLKYPEVELEFISYKGYNMTGYIRECMEAGELPDIVTTTCFVDEELQKERLVDLSKYSFVNNYSDSWLNRCNVDGSIYMLPSNYSAIGFYYNKTVMEEHGWQLPRNFQEFKELAEKIKAVGLKPCVARMDLEGFIFSDFFGLGNTFFFNTKEGELWKNDFLTGKANAKGNIEPVISYLNEWVEEGFISEEDINNEGTSEQFYRGEAVFMFCNGIGLMKQELEGIGTMEYGIMPWLAPEGDSKMIVSSVSRYYGLNKNLEKEENKQKLEDALKVMEFIATDEGMSMLRDEMTAISPLNTSEIKEDNVYYEIKDYIVGGNTIPLVYVGWDDIIIPLSQELYSLVRREQTVEECVVNFDKIRDQWLETGAVSFGEVTSSIGKEETAKIVGKSVVEEKNADAALISLGEYHGYGLENSQGVQCGIYPGTFTLDRLRTIVPAGRMGIIKLSGEEILRRKEEGKYMVYTNQEIKDPTPFPYVLVLKEGLELNPKEEYSVVICAGDLEEELQKEMRDIWGAMDTQKMMEEYIRSHPEVLSSK